MASCHVGRDEGISNAVGDADNRLCNAWTAHIPSTILVGCRPPLAADISDPVYREDVAVLAFMVGRRGRVSRAARGTGAWNGPWEAPYI